MYRCGRWVVFVPWLSYRERPEGCMYERLVYAEILLFTTYFQRNGGLVMGPHII
jgi:hypothetical protein